MGFSRFGPFLHIGREPNTQQFGIAHSIPIFVQKYQVGLLVFFSLNLVSIFEKNYAIWSLFVKFLELDQGFFVKMKVVNKDDLLYWCN